eukprot:3314862-Lingulodinium_polyedra.AAC.1
MWKELHSAYTVHQKAMKKYAHMIQNEEAYQLPAAKLLIRDARATICEAVILCSLEDKDAVAKQITELQKMDSLFKDDVDDTVCA